MKVGKNITVYDSRLGKVITLYKTVDEERRGCPKHFWKGSDFYYVHGKTINKLPTIGDGKGRIEIVYQNPHIIRDMVYIGLDKVWLISEKKLSMLELKDKTVVKRCEDLVDPKTEFIFDISSVQETKSNHPLLLLINSYGICYVLNTNTNKSIPSGILNNLMIHKQMDKPEIFFDKERKAIYLYNMKKSMIFSVTYNEDYAFTCLKEYMWGKNQYCGSLLTRSTNNDIIFISTVVKSGLFGCDVLEHSQDENGVITDSLAKRDNMENLTSDIQHSLNKIGKYTVFDRFINLIKKEIITELDEEFEEESKKIMEDIEKIKKLEDEKEKLVNLIRENLSQLSKYLKEYGKEKNEDEKNKMLDSLKEKSDVLKENLKRMRELVGETDKLESVLKQIQETDKLKIEDLKKVKVN